MVVCKASYTKKHLLEPSPVRCPAWEYKIAVAERAEIGMLHCVVQPNLSPVVTRSWRRKPSLGRATTAISHVTSSTSNLFFHSTYNTLMFHHI